MTEEIVLDPGTGLPLTAEEKAKLEGEAEVVEESVAEETPAEVPAEEVLPEVTE